jgi:hypothetical protein
MNIRESWAKVLAGISDVNGALILRKCSTIGTDKGFMEDRLFLETQPPAAHPGIRRFTAYLTVRTSQDCGSCTARGPEKSGLLRTARFLPRCDVLLTMTVDKPRKPGL